MGRVLLTELVVRNTAPPKKGQKSVFDTLIHGFHLRISYGGSRTFCVLYGESRRRITIGQYPVISLAQARAEAKLILAEKTLGRERGTVSFKTALEEFLEYKEQSNKASSFAETKRLLTKYLLPEYQSEALDRITARSLADTFKRRVKSRGELTHLHKVTKTFFRWAVKAQYVPYSPSEALEDPRRSASRERVLDKPELAKVATYALSEGSGTFGTIVALLILTGQRRAQIAGLRADMVDVAGGTISFPPYLMKSGKGHTIPLVGRAAAILKGAVNRQPRRLLFPARGHPDVAFNGWSRVKVAFDRNCGVTDPRWTLHDLRRTFSTYCSELNENREVVERVLSHTVNTGGVRGIYDRYRCQTDRNVDPRSASNLDPSIA